MITFVSGIIIFGTFAAAMNSSFAVMLEVDDGGGGE